MLAHCGLFALIVFSTFILASEPDWSEGAMVPPGGRANILELSADEEAEFVRKGRIHTLNYPVEVSGLLLPFGTIESFFDNRDSSLWKRVLQSLFKLWQGYESFDDLQEWMGLYRYPERSTPDIPVENDDVLNYRMGLTKLHTLDGPALSVSCAQCHSANLFGQKVLGMTNPVSRANELFLKGQQAFALASPERFQWMTNASDSETKLYARSYQSMQFVGLKRPLALGLDTSLAQVSLSLAKRALDGYASRDYEWSKSPRDEVLSRKPADSKPAVWWTLKYKNRWLSDGSLVSGNPIFTNFLWNEIGRGTDLVELESWLEQNQKIVDELTAATFATKAPSYFDFFDAEEFDIEAAMQGEVHFENMCSKCHGQYVKGWSTPDAGERTVEELLETVFVLPLPATRVFDVGTDPNRYEGMNSLTQLNDLEISKKYNILIRPQRGYVPPPLNGIWARWPYFHNNSAATLCDVLTPSAYRPSWYYLQPPRDPEHDFDAECNGYPRVSRRRIPRLRHDRVIRLGREGLKKSGHDEGIFVKNGVNQLTSEMRIQLVRYLQTL